MQYITSGIVILFLASVTPDIFAQHPDPTSPSELSAQQPRTLQDLATVASNTIPGTWIIEKGNRLCGRDMDEQGHWKWSCILIEHPKYSDNGRKVAQEMGTIWDSLLYVVAQNDSFLLIKGYGAYNLQGIAESLGLKMVESPKDIRRFVVEDCGLVWNGLRLEKENGGQQSVPGYDAQGASSPEP